MAKEIIMPALGMSQETGIIIAWLVKEGEQVKKGDVLLEVETDKTTVELEAEHDGVLRGIRAAAGDEVPVATVIGWIADPDEAIDQPQTAAKPANVKPSPKTSSVQATPVAQRMAAEHGISLEALDPPAGKKIGKQEILQHLEKRQQAPTKLTPASPLARRLASEQKIDLTQLSGSGPNGAVIAADIKQPKAAPAIEKAEVDSPHPIPMSRAWRTAAGRLTEAWQTIPHFYLERDCDVTELIAWRKVANVKAPLKITYTDLLVKAVAAALEHHPRLNASWINGEIIPNREINIGLAVAIKDGLLVPVVHQANQLRLNEITAARKGLVERALSGKSKMADLQGGTFSISNLGMQRIDRFSAIINPPQVAILAVGNITERVIPYDGVPTIRPMMTLTLSLDHRAVDGARGAEFLDRLVGFITQPLTML